MHACRQTARWHCELPALGERLYAAVQVMSFTRRAFALLAGSFFRSRSSCIAHCCCARRFAAASSSSEGLGGTGAPASATCGAPASRADGFGGVVGVGPTLDD